MSTIHPTALISDDATLAEGVEVGPHCHVDGPVTLGRGTRLIANVTVVGRTTLGADNVVWPGAVLGGDPQDLKYRGEDSALVIGDRNQIREHVTVHKGTANAEGVTRIGDDNLIMAYCHLGHDGQIGHRCVIANGVQFAGHVRIEDHAVIGGATALHHFVTVGEYAYVGGMTRVIHDVPPYMIVDGNPAVVRGYNAVALKRNGFSRDAIHALKEAYRRLYSKRAENHGAALQTGRVLAELEAEYGDLPEIERLVEAVRAAAAGIHGRWRETMRSDDRYANPLG